ncbi:hypothetical protein JHK87_008709 [Glycine soja]|nr:hypothetical protein JHK87_008709 [Glycine soja]
MDPNISPRCPGTITVRRNPPRRSRTTPKTTPQSSHLPKIVPFPNDDVLSAQTPEIPSTPLPKPENENLKVFLRIRPLPSSPVQAPRVRPKSVWPQNPAKKIAPAPGAKISKNKNPSACITVNDSQSVTLSTPVSSKESKRIKSETYGGFSHVFSSDSSQFQVYERMVKPLVEEFLRGRSGMLAALGPSGSGKTYTVFGTPRDPGMVPLALRHIFEDTEPHAIQASRTFYMSIFEICSERGNAEKLFDLLSDGSEISMQQSTVKGLKEVIISNTEQAESLIAQATLKRATAMTNTNSQSRVDQSDEKEPMLGISCTQLDSEHSERGVLSFSKPEHHSVLYVDAGSKILSNSDCKVIMHVIWYSFWESFHAYSSPEATLDQFDEEPMLDTFCSQLESEKSDREISTSLSKVEDHNALEVEAGSKIQSESFHAYSLSKATLDQSDEEPALSTSCTQLDSEKSYGEISTSLPKAEDHNALGVDAGSKIPSEVLHSESSFEPRLEPSDEEPMPGVSCTKLDSEKSDRKILVSPSKQRHNPLDVGAETKIPCESFVSSSLTKDDILDPLSPKDVSSNKTHNLVGDQRDKSGVDSSRKPPKPKRTLMPSSSILSRDLSTFDLCDESEKLKGNRGTRKLPAPDPKRSNGSISLLHMLQGRKGNLHR